MAGQMQVLCAGKSPEREAGQLPERERPARIFSRIFSAAAGAVNASETLALRRFACHKPPRPGGVRLVILQAKADWGKQSGIIRRIV